MSPVDEALCPGCAVRCRYCLKDHLPPENWPRLEGRVETDPLAVPRDPLAAAIALWWRESAAMWRGEQPAGCCGQS